MTSRVGWVGVFDLGHAKEALFLREALDAQRFPLTVGACDVFEVAAFGGAAKADVVVVEHVVDLPEPRVSRLQALRVLDGGLVSDIRWNQLTWAVRVALGGIPLTSVSTSFAFPAERMRQSQVRHRITCESEGGKLKRLYTTFE
jgi:hypothetical protein